MWYYFDDLEEGPAFRIGDFNALKLTIKKTLTLEIVNKYIIKSKIRICYCFYRRNKCKGYENYIQKIKKIIGI